MFSARARICCVTAPKSCRHKHWKKRLVQLQAKINTEQCHQEAALQRKKKNPASPEYGSVRAGFSSGHREEQLSSPPLQGHAAVGRGLPATHGHAGPADTTREPKTKARALGEWMLWMDQVQVQSWRSNGKIRIRAQKGCVLQWKHRKLPGSTATLQEYSVSF